MRFVHNHASWLLLFLVLTQIVDAGEFINLGFQPEGISSDGRLVYGRQFIESTNQSYPVMWTRETGIVTLGNWQWAASNLEIGGDISSDGRVIVGGARSLVPPGQLNNIVPFRWTNEEGLQPFGDLPPLLTEWEDGYATDVSADGSVIVGRSRLEAFRWTAESGMFILPSVSGKTTGFQSAMSVSGDGKVIAGRYGEDVTSINSTFRWTEETGSIDIGRLPGSTSMRPRDISGDGETLVGVSLNGPTQTQAWRWSPAGGVVELGILNGHQGSDAWTVSNDGKVVLGNSFTGSEQGEMFWWDATAGLQNLSQRLSDEFNAQVDGRSAHPTGISDDRKTVVGWGQGQNAGWLAVFDSSLGAKSVIPGDFNKNGLLDADDIDLLMSEIRGGVYDPTFDLNSDSVLDQSDVTTWVHELEDSFFGDANLDGEFNSGDLVEVFTVGKYEMGQESGWAEGDWNGDGLFGSGDLVFAFQDGGYEHGPRVAVSAVPEPSTALLLVLAAALTVSSIAARCRFDRSARPADGT
jgi:uncharacterized membrane protein